MEKVDMVSSREDISYKEIQLAFVLLKILWFSYFKHLVDIMFYGKPSARRGYHLEQPLAVDPLPSSLTVLAEFISLRLYD